MCQTQWLSSTRRPAALQSSHTHKALVQTRVWWHVRGVTVRVRRLCDKHVTKAAAQNSLLPGRACTRGNNSTNATASGTSGAGKKEQAVCTAALGYTGMPGPAGCKQGAPQAEWLGHCPGSPVQQLSTGV